MTEAELDAISKACSCGRDHRTEGVGECDVPALVAEVRRLRVEADADEAQWRKEFWAIYKSIEALAKRMEESGRDATDVWCALRLVKHPDVIPTGE